MAIGKPNSQPVQAAFEVTRQPDNTVTIKITIPWHEVEKVRQEVENEMVKNVSISGFRKGRAPQNVAKAKLDKTRVNEEVLKRILPKYYTDALKENNINPIVNPRIHIEQFSDGTNLEFTAETCEEPKVDLKNYKDEVKKITAKSKIIIPSKSEEEVKPSLEEIVQAVIANTEVKIPRILLEQETNRLLSQFLDELKTLGLTLDQYLASKGAKGEELRREYEGKAEKNLKLEFILRKIADTEKIAVEQKDIDEAINAVKDEKQRNELTKNPYLVATIIRQQKTLNFLTTL